MLACLPGAISRIAETGTVFINPDICINCASCAMACPFGVIRYHQDASAPPGKTIAVKCDNCQDRQKKGRTPACAEACKSGALTFEEPSAALKRKTDQVARSISAESVYEKLPPGVALLNAVKKAQIETREAGCHCR
jgi:carbon-monoxide dehydrogenase iron sulfur subunit